LLFFIDESWQDIGARRVGALGGVGIPEPRYNSFCREVFAIKRDVLGAKELTDSELRGNSCFAKAAFRKREAAGASRLLEAAERTLAGSLYRANRSSAVRVPERSQPEAGQDDPSRRLEGMKKGPASPKAL
jgi:hypothetical protein